MHLRTLGHGCGAAEAVMVSQKQFWPCPAGTTSAAIDLQKRTHRSGRGAKVRAHRCGPCSQMRNQYPLSHFRTCDGFFAGAVEGSQKRDLWQKRGQIEGSCHFSSFGLESSELGDFWRDFHVGVWGK